jgi:hypothetical protein
VGWVEAMPLNKTPVYRNLGTRVTFLGLVNTAAFMKGNRGHMMNEGPQRFPRYATGMVPPSIGYSVPVIVAANGDARNTMRFATSIGVDGRPSGMPPSEFTMMFFLCL